MNQFNMIIDNDLLFYIAIIILDVISAIILTKFLGQTKHGKFTSDKFRGGIVKKIGCLVLWVLLVLMNKKYNIEPIFQFSTKGLILAEVISLLENLNLMGVKIPKPFQDYINKEDDEND